MKSSKFPVNIAVLLAIALMFGLAMGMLIISNNPSSLSSPSAIVPSGGSSRLRVGQPAPDFTLNTLTGTPVKLSELRGKRVLVNFWASWCAPCLQEIPDLKTAYTDLQKTNSDIVFVGIGYQDKTENLKSFVETNKMPYTIVEDNTGKTGDAYNILGMPTSFFIDSSGVLQQVETGILTKAEVLKQFEKLK